MMGVNPARRGLGPRAAAVLLAALAGTLLLTAQEGGPYPGKEWARAERPEALGYSAEKLQRVWDYAGRIDTAALLLVVDGVVLAEWGETARKFNCHSIRKSLLSALYGIHVAAGDIQLARTVGELGIEDNPPLTEAERRATVGDLLKARSGVYHRAAYETPNMKLLRPRRGSHPPGTFWYYNNWDFNALGTIFEQETGTKIFEEFKRRIAEPLQMEDFRVEDGTYFRGPESLHPAYPFRMTARDLARFGLLYLRRGRWSDQQIVPADWVAASTQAYSDAGPAGGYGYLWWVAVEGRHLPGVRMPAGSFSARGYGGHYILVIPSEKLVIVHRVNTDEPERRVSDAQFGRLVKLILAARIPASKAESQ
jgi:CubicO group peptidase (beta-lactamase class C family)